MKFRRLAFALAMGATLWTPCVTSAGVTRSDRASELLASARRRIAQGSHEQRQFALTELQEAFTQAPARTDIALALGDLYLEADCLRQSLDVARRLTASDPDLARGWLLEGRVWRRYWLATIDHVARDRGIACLARSARKSPREARAWALLTPMLVDAGEYEAARDAAVAAARASPNDAETQVLLAAALQNTGDLEDADRLFRRAVPRLPAARRERFDDIRPLIPPRELEEFVALDASARQRFTERFWADNDPDPVSIENEAQLEFWARVTQATSLYGASGASGWDMRIDYYVRFGRPALEELNPIGKPEFLHDGDWLAWTYPDLGLRVWTGTATTFHGYPGSSAIGALWARAWPESLDRHGELHPVNGGWAVFHRLAPGWAPLEARLALARFQAENGATLFAQAEAPGSPEEEMTVEWVLLDSTDTPVTRDARVMSPSACRVDEARAASFVTPLTPGSYRVGLRVSDGRSRRGSVRREIVVAPVTGPLALSDLVVTCGPPAHSVVRGSGVRLEPTTGLFPEGGDQLSAYFEIYHLASSANGDSRFEYQCSVRSAVRDRRGWLSRLIAPREAPPPIEMSRVETTRGPTRRQFLSVPVGSLPAGRYELAVVVRDVANGATARAAVPFERRR